MIVRLSAHYLVTVPRPRKLSPRLARVTLLSLLSPVQLNSYGLASGLHPIPPGSASSWSASNPPTPNRPIINAASATAPTTGGRTTELSGVALVQKLRSDLTSLPPSETHRVGVGSERLPKDAGEVALHHISTNDPALLHVEHHLLSRGRYN